MYFYFFLKSRSKVPKLALSTLNLSLGAGLTYQGRVLAGEKFYCLS